jgi:hypothetical protein
MLESSLAIRKTDQDRLTTLLRPRLGDLQLGNLRFYIEQVFSSEKSFCESTAGIEVFITPNRPNTFVPAALSGSKPFLSSTKLTTDLIAWFLDKENKTLATNFLNDGLTFIDNFFATLHETYLSLEPDQMRPGIGLYINPSILIGRGRGEVFAKIRGNYLFETSGITVFPLKNCDSLNTVAFVTKQSPLGILQLNLGFALHARKMHFYCGYDFYLQNGGIVGNIADAHDINHVDLTPKLATDRAARPATTHQHRLFTSLAYKNSLFGCNYSAGLSANWDFMSSKDVFNKVGIAITLGAGF